MIVVVCLLSMYVRIQHFVDWSHPAFLPLSSAFSSGLFTENGPIIPIEGGVKLNDYSWNKFANVLYLDAPAGVGFSFSDDHNDYNTNNNKTAADNYSALQGFLEKFPQYSKNSLYITGESYGGDYVPQLVYTIVNGESKALSNMLEGFIIGNPVFSCKAWRETANDIQVNLFYYHGLIPITSLIEWKGQGCSATPNSDSCNNLMEKYTAQIGPFDSDNLYTNVFTGNASLGVGDTPKHSLQDLERAYLNRADVQEAIHARPTSWVPCCSEVGQSGSPCQLNYTNNWTNMLPTYFSFFDNVRFYLFP